MSKAFKLQKTVSYVTTVAVAKWTFGMQITPSIYYYSSRRPFSVCVCVCMCKFVDVWMQKYDFVFQIYPLDFVGSEYLVKRISEFYWLRFSLINMKFYGNKLVDIVDDTRAIAFRHQIQLVTTIFFHHCAVCSVVQSTRFSQQNSIVHLFAWFFEFVAYKKWSCRIEFLQHLSANTYLSIQRIVKAKKL